MSAKTEFRKNFKKTLKEKQLTASSFSNLSGISRSKIQRLSDTSENADGAIDLDDADSIATALGTTLGYMTGNKYTDDMLDQTKKMYDYFVIKKQLRRHIKKIMSDAETEDEIHSYLKDILMSVDVLGHKSKKNK
tara:strand:- start:290 stop:694 length:405 start_codon:yes stop_codon:yes gene_type:complete